MTDPKSLYTIIKEIFLILDDGDRQLFNEFGLTLPRFYALYHLNAHPGESLSYLSDLMLCDKSNVTRIIKGLETEGMVQRKPHETDRRAIRLYLTAVGAQLLAQVMEAHNAYVELRFRSIYDITEDDLMDNLEKVKEGLRSQLTGYKRVTPPAQTLS